MKTTPAMCRRFFWGGKFMLERVIARLGGVRSIAPPPLPRAVAISRGLKHKFAARLNHKFAAARGCPVRGCAASHPLGFGEGSPGGVDGGSVEVESHCAGAQHRTPLAKSVARECAAAYPPGSKWPPDQVRSIAPPLRPGTASEATTPVPGASKTAVSRVRSIAPPALHSGANQVRSIAPPTKLPAPPGCAASHPPGHRRTGRQRSR